MTGVMSGSLHRRSATNHYTTNRVHAKSTHGKGMLNEIRIRRREITGGYVKKWRPTLSSCQPKEVSVVGTTTYLTTHLHDTFVVEGRETSDLRSGGGMWN